MPDAWLSSPNTRLPETSPSAGCGRRPRRCRNQCRKPGCRRRITTLPETKPLAWLRSPTHDVADAGARGLVVVAGHEVAGEEAVGRVAVADDDVAEASAGGLVVVTGHDVAGDEAVDLVAVADDDVAGAGTGGLVVVAGHEVAGDEAVAWLRSPSTMLPCQCRRPGCRRRITRLPEMKPAAGCGRRRRCCRCRAGSLVVVASHEVAGDEAVGLIAVADRRCCRAGAGGLVVVAGHDVAGDEAGRLSCGRRRRCCRCRCRKPGCRRRTRGCRR